MDNLESKETVRLRVILVGLALLVVAIVLLTSRKHDTPIPEPKQPSAHITCPANCTCVLQAGEMNVECKPPDPVYVPPEIIRETKIIEYHEDPAITVIGQSREGGKCTLYVRVRISGEYYDVGLNCAPSAG